MCPAAQRLRSQSALRWILASAVAVAFSGLLYAHFLLLDGIRGIVFPIFFRDTTIYASGYKEDVFRQLRLGVDTAEVVRVLGPPLQKDICAGLERWRYSQSRSDSHYRMRQITFESGRVVAKSSYYVVD